MDAYQLREALHRLPELSFQEHGTTKLLKELCTHLQQKSSVPIILHTPLETGLVVEYRGGKEGDSYQLFRADIDALPIQEKNFHCPFRSTNNFMHACGHDLHTAILYALLQDLVENPRTNNLLLLFQPAEEEGGGAEKILATCFFESFAISAAYALHVTDEYALGQIASRTGNLFAAALAIDVHFTGRPAHVAFPQMAKNPLSAMRYWMDRAEEVLPQELLFGIGKVYSGNVRNIYPESAHLEGTIRGHSKNETLGYLEKLGELLEETKKKFDIQAEIKTISFYAPVINHQETTRQAKEKLMTAKVDWVECEAKMTGEDFGFFTERFPSFMFWLGTCQAGEKAVGLHHPEFLPSHQVIQQGLQFFKILIRTSP